ncbi:thiol reductase thioredoxin [Bacillus thuringiensis]|uniref:Thioredoxin n=2 Tax=Bacillus cereus group TaxID=86661 RepID=A0A9W7Q6T3_BACCE|nr:MULTISPECIES: thioredoxin family protein [Bacillus]AXR19670.1 thioredoxin [Bacillus sp. CR71]AXR25403.1 thioredoxin [Bacillus sp. E25]KAA6470073.1 thioredoxin [Bacillus cereus]KAB2481276.1 thioredoxin family protein [Bacillus cereus]KAB2503699.1 thioredoxin family protein [Bacillus cereus]
MKKLIIFSSLFLSVLILCYSFNVSTTKTKEMYYQKQITPDQLQSKILNKEHKVVYFYQTNCQYCKNVTPIVIPMAEKMNINMEVINLEENPEGWKEFNIEGTPTIVNYKNGKEINRIEGEESEEMFKDWFNKSKH